MPASAEWSLTRILDVLQSVVVGTSTSATALISRMLRAYTTATATIANGATVSDAVDMRGYSGGGYALPSTFDGTALTFQVSVDGVTYQTLYDQYGSPLSITVAASRSFPLPQEIFGWAYFKFVAGTAQSTTATLIPVVLAG